MSELALNRLAAPMRLDAIYLPLVDNGRSLRGMRDVHPVVRRFDGWVSSVGAAIALADIAGSGRPADICLVDPRNDSVSVMAAPETGNRFAPFTLPIPSEGYAPETIAPMGCLPADVNEDGFMDLVVYCWGRTPLVFLRIGTTGISKEAFSAVEIVKERQIWNSNAAIFADIDGDGHPDLIVGNYYPDDQRVLDTSATDDFHQQHSMSRAYNGGTNRLLLWQGSSVKSVTFRDASTAFTPEMANGWTLALAARDLNDDGLPELYVANDFGPDRLLLNKSTSGQPQFQIVEGGRDFTTPRSKVLGRDSFKGMGVDFGDVVGDGRPAIAVSNISAPYALLESNFLFVPANDQTHLNGAIPSYRDESGPRGVWTSEWAWDVKFADLLNTGRPALIQAIGFLHGDQDRWPELQELAMGNDEFLSNPSVWPRFSVGDDLSGHSHDRIFVPDRSGQYHDIWLRLGLDAESVSRGVATGDVFGDGRLAVAIARQWSPSLFIKNSSTTGRAISIDLRVPGSIAGSRAAIGAEARLMLPDGRIVASVVDGGSGHSGKRAPDIHLGLGAVSAESSFDVAFAWRDRTGFHRQTASLRPGRYVIVLGDELTISSSSGPNHPSEMQ